MPKFKSPAPGLTPGSGRYRAAMDPSERDWSRLIFDHVHLRADGTNVEAVRRDLTATG